MAYQRIDLLAKDLSVEGVTSALGEIEPVDLFFVKREDGLDLATLVVDDAVNEAAIESLERRYGKQDTFQLFVYDIAARLPRPSEAQTRRTAENKDARERISREELLDDLEPGSRVRWIYIAQVLISCVVAAIGMIRDSVVLVIAAMVIAPLLIPCMSLALGTTVGDLRMVWRSVQTAVAGVAAGFAMSLGIGLLVVFDPAVYQLSSRAEVRYTDLVVAIAAGVAGALSVTTGVSASLIGVMVAVALVPPLVAGGLFIGGGEWDAAAGAALLLVSNIVCVNLAAVGVFLIQGIRPSRWAEQDRAKLAVRHALTIWTVLLVVLVVLIGVAAPENPL
ncbi:MAG: TIGR00341 family protein [Phycisphaeraceae bacterium]